MTNTSFRPSNFMLIPTAACQNSCVYCFGPNQDETMSCAVVNGALDFMARIAPPEGRIYVTFHGGEPLLAGYEYYEYILPRLQALFGNRLRLSMQTNLLALDERMADLIHDWRIAIGTSTDGYESLCDKQRGAGYYAANERGRSLLLRRGVPVSRICTLTHTSAGEAERVFRHYAGEPPLTGEPYALHGAVRAIGRQADEAVVSADDMTNLLMDTLAAYRDHIAQTRVTTLDGMVKGCFDGEGHICTFFSCLGRFAAIAPDGGVYSCQRFCGHTEFMFGNVLDGLNEDDIVKSASYRMLFGKQRDAETACADCIHAAYCNGGCLYNICASGTLKDPYCEAYRNVFDVIARDMALEMGWLLTGRIDPKDAPLLQMAGDIPHPYDRALNRQRLHQAVNWGRYPYGVSQTLERYKQNMVHELNKLYLHVTFACPLRCKHCYAEGGERDMQEMPANAAIEIIREARDALFRSVVITGGEPFAHSEIDSILASLADFDRKGMRLILRTSLSFQIVDTQLGAMLKAFPEIVVSVGGDEANHDERRGAGRYAATIANLERIRDMGYIKQIGVCATLSRLQRDGPEGGAVTALCKRLGITNVRFRSVLPLGRASEVKADESFLCIDETDQTRSFRPRFSCGLGQNLYVEPDGGAYPCYAWCGADKRLGNLLTERLPDILEGDAFRKLKKYDVDANEKCRTCAVRYLCGGVCKAWSNDKQNIESGDFDCSARKAAFERLADLL